MRENSSPAGLQFVTLGVIPRYILKATCPSEAEILSHNDTIQELQLNDFTGLLILMGFIYLEPTTVTKVT